MITRARDTQVRTATGDPAFREALRNVIAAARLAADQGGRPQVLGVTSPRHGEGKTTLAMGLAGVLATDQEVNVVLVDADFDSHSLGEAYELDGDQREGHRGAGPRPKAQVGLTEVLAGEATLKDGLRRIPGTRLDLLVAGAPSADAGRFAQSARFPVMLDELRESYPYVVLDLPGVLDSASARTLARACDGVVVVAETRRTNVMDLQQALERLEDTHVLGVVLNQWRSPIPGWIERPLGLRR